MTLADAANDRPALLVDALDEQLFGGKAAKLARAVRAGLPVPAGFALATVHVEAVYRGHADTLRALREEFARLAGPCAVRSSALGEDSERTSFAGQHLTLLNVRDEDQIAPAVIRVRDSAHAESALAYRRTMGMEGVPRIGVVVQRMIDPDCAGVMFTRNPISGANERIVEAAWGLGEAVVAGLVVPDHYEMASDGGLLRHAIGCKDIAVRGAAEGATREEPLPDDLANARCLDDPMLAQLHQLATRCEEVFGRGLDIEWGFVGERVYLLQCRAMTRTR